MERFVSEIFIKEPDRWGLRGDPFLWRYLKEYYSAVAAPYSAEKLRSGILSAFEHFAGELPVSGKFHRADEFAKTHVGMSTGGLSDDFWLDTAIPLLMNRLEQLNANLGEKI